MGPISASERASLIAEPFWAMNFMVETNAKKYQGYAFFCVLWLAVVACSLYGLAQPGMLSNAARLAIAAGLIGTAAGVIQVVRKTRGGWIRVNAQPMLVRALEPLKPTPDELETALGMAHADGLRIGKIVKAGRLVSDLAANELTKPIHSGRPRAAA